jgi:hypothetical protein
MLQPAAKTLVGERNRKNWHDMIEIEIQAEMLTLVFGSSKAETRVRETVNETETQHNSIDKLGKNLDDFLKSRWW